MDEERKQYVGFNASHAGIDVNDATLAGVSAFAEIAVEPPVDVVPTDVGKVHSNSLTLASEAGAEQWFRVQATRDGPLDIDRWGMCLAHGSWIRDCTFTTSGD